MDLMSLNMNIKPAQHFTPAEKIFLETSCGHICPYYSCVTEPCHRQYCRFLASPLVKAEMFSVKCYLSMCSPVPSKELESVQDDLLSLFLLFLSKNIFDIAWVYSSGLLKS